MYVCMYVSFSATAADQEPETIHTATVARHVCVSMHFHMCVCVYVCACVRMQCHFSASWRLSYLPSTSRHNHSYTDSLQYARTHSQAGSRRTTPTEIFTTTTVRSTCRSTSIPRAAQTTRAYQKATKRRKRKILGRCTAASMAARMQATTPVCTTVADPPKTRRIPRTTPAP